MKHSTKHSINQVAAITALEEFLLDNDLPIELANAQADWWVDVGLEVASTDKRCLAFRTDSHCHIVSEVLGITLEQAQKITTPGSSSYTRDMTSHFTQVSGCRIAPGVRTRGECEVQYFQMYTTDKSLTYRVDGYHYGKFLTCDKIMKGKSTTYIQGLYELYVNAAETAYSLARIEVRVPIRFGCDVLPGIGEQVLRGSLVSFSGEEWW
jgi:hypothetical protein